MRVIKCGGVPLVQPRRRHSGFRRGEPGHYWLDRNGLLNAHVHAGFLRPFLHRSATGSRRGGARVGAVYPTLANPHSAPVLSTSAFFVPPPPPPMTTHASAYPFTLVLLVMQSGHICGIPRRRVCDNNGRCSSRLQQFLPSRQPEDLDTSFLLALIMQLLRILSQIMCDSALEFPALVAKPIKTQI